MVLRMTALEIEVPAMVLVSATKEVVLVTFAAVFFIHFAIGTGAEGEVLSELINVK